MMSVLPPADAVSPDDDADLRQAQSGDADAFGRLVERHQIRVGGWLRHFTRDPGSLADLVQETFVEAYQSLANFRGDGAFLGWLKRIAVRMGYRYWQKRDARKRQEAAYVERAATQRTSWEEASAAEAAEHVHGLLARLPPRDRVVLTLLYLEEHSIEETAKLLGWSEVMVRVQSHRARAKLKPWLERNV